MKAAITLFSLILYINSAFGVVYTERPEGFKPVVEVSALFIEKEGKYLFLHRQENKSHGNTWAIPGGKVDKGETALEAIVREMQEETAISLHPDALDHVKTVYIVHPNGVHFIYHMFSCSYDGSWGITINPVEHKGFTWVTLSDALQMNLMDDEAPCIEIKAKG